MARWLPLLLVVACGPATSIAPLTRIAGAPVAGPAVARTELPADGALALVPVDGRLGLADGSGLRTLDLEGALQSVPVAPAPGEPLTTGASQRLYRRAAGVLLWAQNGLFHDRAGKLLVSPLTQNLTGMAPTAVDVWGLDAAEELWLVSDGALHHVEKLQLSKLELTGIEGAPELMVGIAPGQALLTAGGRAFTLDLTGGTATAVAEGLGATHAAARGSDGAVYVATASGLLERAPDGKLSLYTLAAEGQSGVEVTDVIADHGVVALVSGGQLHTLSKGVFTTVAALAAPVRRGLMADGNGDLWALDGTKAARFATGTPVLFADVVPFFEDHCQVCHRTGTQGAPLIDFTDYPTAQRFGPTALTRLRADATSPMPPRSIETLAEADYAVVTRWVAGGMKP